jgi:hypothetical protein
MPFVDIRAPPSNGGRVTCPSPLLSRDVDRYVTRLIFENAVLDSPKIDTTGVNTAGWKLLCHPNTANCHKTKMWLQ